MGTTRDVARIVDYQRFYKPKMKEFVKGFAYEYVQLSYKQLLVHLPDIDSEDRKPGCIYYQNWAKAIWGAPWSVMKLSNLKELMKKDKVRAKKKLSTKYFKNLLEKQPIAFNWRGLHVVVFPKKTIQRDGIEILDNHKVYMNGVEYTLIKGKPDSKLFNKLLRYKFSENLDWAYLLEFGNGIQTNSLYQYFEGIFTKDEDVFEKIGVNFKTGGPENPPQSKKNAGMPRGYYAKHKKQLKETKYEGVDGHMNPIKHKAKSEDDLSGHVLETREIARVKRIEQTIKAEIAAHKTMQKEAARIIAADKNHQKMELLAMVCIQNTETEEVLRVTQHASVKYHLTGHWVYVEKYMWKVDPPAKGKSGEFIGAPRKTRRFKKKREGKFIQHKKKPKEYEEDLVVEIDKWPESEYEYIPVVYGKRHAKAGQPFMIFGYDDEGNKIAKQAVRRRLKQVFDAAKQVYVGCKLVKVERKVRVAK